MLLIFISHIDIILALNIQLTSEPLYADYLVYFGFVSFFQSTICHVSLTSTAYCYFLFNV